MVKDDLQNKSVCLEPFQTWPTKLSCNVLPFFNNCQQGQLSSSRIYPLVVSIFISVDQISMIHCVDINTTNVYVHA